MKINIIKASLATIFVSLFLLAGSPAYATTPPDSCFAFSGGIITSYHNNEGNNPANPACPKDVDIPSTIGGVPVTALGTISFQGAQLTSVTIPNSVTIINDDAFNNNQLISVVIPNSVITIGDSAFFNNNLTSVTLSNTLTSIGDSAFYDNDIGSITLPNTLTSIGDRAFYGNNLTSLVIPSSITAIGWLVFSSNQLTSVTIPSSVVSIGPSAFSDNQLTSVTIPNSVTSIDFAAFANNQLTSFTLSNTLTSIGDNAFANNKLASVSIPNSVTSIGMGAFTQNELTSLTLGTGLTSLPQDAFSYNRLASVDVPTGITTIDPTAFYLQGANINEIGGGDFSSIMDVYYTRLYTTDPSNPGNLQDAQTIYPEGALGADINGDGDQLDDISAGGHLINPAQATVTYKNATGATLSPTVFTTGIGLTDYIANKNETNDLSRYFRLGSSQSFTAPTIAGYSIITPASPYTTTLLAANTNINFVYSNQADAETGGNSLPINTPNAPDTGTGNVLNVSGILTAIISGLILVGAVAYISRSHLQKQRRFKSL